MTSNYMNTEPLHEALLEEAHELDMDLIREIENDVAKDFDTEFCTIKAATAQIPLGELLSALLYRIKWTNKYYMYIIGGNLVMSSASLDLEGDTLSVKRIYINDTADYNAFEELLDAINRVFFKKDKKIMTLGEYVQYSEDAKAKGYTIK